MSKLPEYCGENYEPLNKPTGRVTSYMVGQITDLANKLWREDKRKKKQLIDSKIDASHIAYYAVSYTHLTLPTNREV